VAAFRYAQPIPGGTRDAIPSQHLIRDRSAPQNGLSAAKRRNDWDRRTAPAIAPSERALCAAHRSNIREWYAIVPPAPNTQPLNIEPLDRFHPHARFSVRAIHIARAVWHVCHIPAGKLPVCFDNLSMHSCVQEPRVSAGLSSRPVAGRMSSSEAGLLPLRGGDDQNQGRGPDGRDEA
jgi:hypothetical protein